MSPIKEWNAAKVKAAIAGRVAQNMERACQFAVEQAKAMAPTRSGTLKRNIMYEVEARGDVVEGRVGVSRLKAGGGIAARRNWGEAFYGYFIEVGTSGYTRQTKHKAFGYTYFSPPRSMPAHPAHPFLRPAIFGNARRIVAIIRGERSS